MRHWIAVGQCGAHLVELANQHHLEVDHQRAIAHKRNQQGGLLLIQDGVQRAAMTVSSVLRFKRNRAKLLQVGQVAPHELQNVLVLDFRADRDRC